MKNLIIFLLWGFLIPNFASAGDICIDCLVENGQIISGEYNEQIIQDGKVQDDRYWGDEGFEALNSPMDADTNVDVDVQVNFSDLECKTQRIGGICLDKK